MCLALSDTLLFFTEGLTYSLKSFNFDICFVLITFPLYSLRALSILFFFTLTIIILFWILFKIMSI